MTVAEAALLAGIPADPSLYDPVANPVDARPAGARCCRRCSPRRTSRTTSTASANRAPLPEARGRPPAGEAAARRRTSSTTSSSSSSTATRSRKVFGGGLRVLTTIDLGAPAARAGGDLEVAPGARRAVGGARRDRPAGRARAGDGRRRELPREPVQPRGAGRAPAGLVVQAVRARDRARAGDLAADELRVEAGDDLARRPRLVRPQLRGLETSGGSTCRRRRRTRTTRSSPS